MRTSYKTLTDAEFNVLNKIADRTKNDCWFWLKQDKYGTDYVWDLEEEKRMCLKTGVGLLCEGLDCQENYDNCWLEWNEKVTFRNLLAKLKIALDVDWKIPVFIGMSKAEFIKLYEQAKVTAGHRRKNGDDYCVDDVVYQFGRDDACFSVVVFGPSIQGLLEYPSSYNEKEI
jgi:hypothetical protein